MSNNENLKNESTSIIKRMLPALIVGGIFYVLGFITGFFVG